MEHRWIEDCDPDTQTAARMMGYSDSTPVETYLKFLAEIAESMEIGEVRVLCEDPLNRQKLQATKFEEPFVRLDIISVA